MLIGVSVANSNNVLLHPKIKSKVEQDACIEGSLDKIYYLVFSWIS